MSRLPIKILSCVLCCFLLAACLESELPLFEETDRSYSVLEPNYAVTDGAKLVGQLVLSENDGAYTVVSWSDEKASAVREPGQMFQLFAAPKIDPPFLRSHGHFDFYWVQAEKEGEVRYEYELIGIARNDDPRRRVVFRWGQWMLMQNDAFQKGLLEIETENGDTIQCGETCTIDSTATLNQVAFLVADTNLAPYRAYVPR